jgi:hypothetical protein
MVSLYHFYHFCHCITASLYHFITLSKISTLYGIAHDDSSHSRLNTRRFNSTVLWLLFAAYARLHAPLNTALSPHSLLLTTTHTTPHTHRRYRRHTASAIIFYLTCHSTMALFSHNYSTTLSDCHYHYLPVPVPLPALSLRPLAHPYLQRTVCSAEAQSMRTVGGR